MASNFSNELCRGEKLELYLESRGLKPSTCFLDRASFNLIETSLNSSKNRMIHRSPSTSPNSTKSSWSPVATAINPERFSHSGWNLVLLKVESKMGSIFVGTVARARRATTSEKYGLKITICPPRSSLKKLESKTLEILSNLFLHQMTIQGQGKYSPEY